MDSVSESSCLAAPKSLLGWPSSSRSPEYDSNAIVLSAVPTTRRWQYCTILLLEIEQTSMITVPEYHGPGKLSCTAVLACSCSCPVQGRRRATCPLLGPSVRSAALGPRGRPDGQGLDYTQCHRASSCGTGARRQGTLYQERSPSSSRCLTAAGNETQDACLAPARPA